MFSLRGRFIAILLIAANRLARAVKLARMARTWWPRIAIFMGIPLLFTPSEPKP